MSCSVCSNKNGVNGCVGEHDFTEKSVHFDVGYKSRDCEIDEVKTWWVTVEVSSSRGSRWSPTGPVDVRLSLSSRNGHISVDSNSNTKQVSVSRNTTAPTKEFNISQGNVSNPPDTGQIDLKAEWRKNQSDQFQDLTSESVERHLS
jgi:hypothetical protein